MFHQKLYNKYIYKTIKQREKSLTKIINFMSKIIVNNIYVWVEIFFSSCYNIKRVGDPMKKVLILLLFMFFLSGCNKDKIDINNYDLILDTFLQKETSLVNNYSKGYKYYLPNGVRVISSDNYNEKLYYDGNYYYLFVDVVSYYYKTNLDYKIDSSLFYSKILEYNDRKGYVEISKEDDFYKIEAYYNYAKVETYVDYDSLGQTLINICYILNSVSFNDAVTKSIVGDIDTKLIEETFDFYTPRKEGNFIDHINKYDEYEEVSDENNIGNEGNE